MYTYTHVPCRFLSSAFLGGALERARREKEQGKRETEEHERQSQGKRENDVAVSGDIAIAPSLVPPVAGGDAVVRATFLITSEDDSERAKGGHESDVRSTVDQFERKTESKNEDKEGLRLVQLDDHGT